MASGWVPLVWRRPALDWAVIAGLLLAAWAASYGLGGSRTVAPHGFYLPVLVAAFRTGRATTAVVALVAGVLAGPLLPLDVAAGTAQPWPNWVARMAAFVVIGLVAADMAGRLRAARAVEAGHAQQRQTILQLVDHELRSPLTVLTSGISLLRQAALPDQVQPMLAPMNNAVDRLESLAVTVAATVTDKHDQDTPVRVRVESVIASALIEFPRDQRGRVIIVAGDPVTVTTYRRPLKTALVCLLDNALRFSADDQPVHIQIEAHDRHCQLAIRDFGPGIPPDQADRLFEPFQQGDSSATREHGGLGLGLFAAHRAVQHCGGTIWLEPPANGPGATATIRIPLQVSSPPEPA